MSTSAFERLRHLPPVFRLADLCQLGSLAPKDASVMLHRWRQRGLVRALAPKAGVYFNLVAAPDWRPHLETALARTLPTALRVGEGVLQQAGWTTQSEKAPAYAVLADGLHARIDDVLLVDRPASWYAAVRQGDGVAPSRSAVPCLKPAWALADALAFGDVWVPAPDDLYVDDSETAGFLRAWSALAPHAPLPEGNFEDPFAEVYARIYETKTAEPKPRRMRLRR